MGGSGSDRRCAPRVDTACAAFPPRRGVSAVAIVTGCLEAGGTLPLLALRSPSALRTGFERIRRDPYMRVLERGCIPGGGHVWGTVVFVLQ